MLPYINTPFAYAGGLTGAAIDELKLITSFLLSYPLAAILKRIPDSKPAYKNLFNVGVSLFYLVGLFDLWTGVRTILISSAGAYLIAGNIRGGFMPWIAFVFLMGHMSINHIYRQAHSLPGTVDVTGAQMVLIMKLTAFCWNVYDGTQPPEFLADYQKERMIVKLPSVLDFAGYVFFFPGLMAGPAFDYVDYQRWINTTMFDAPPGVPASKLPPTRKKRRIPQSHTPALFKAVTGLLWIFLFLQASAIYNPALILGDDFMKYSFVRRVWLLHMLGFTTRMKYYGVWTLTEGACILSGLGYAGIDTKTGKILWNRLQNVDPIAQETAQNTRAYLDAWNKNTNNWLKNYMYLRVTPRGKKPGFRASMATFATSAFWHGFYPGYYLAFVLAAFLQTVAKNFRRYVRPFFLTPSGAPLPSKRAYDFFSYLVTQLSFSFTVAAFILLSLPDCLKAWASVWFYCPIGVALSMAFFASPAKAWLIRQLSKRNRPGVKQTPSYDGHASGALGIPGDPAKEVEDAVREAREQVEELRRKGVEVERVSIKGVKIA